MNNRKKITLYLAQGAMIAAIYVAITMVLAPISFGHIQLRVSEALTILPVFTPAAIPGLFVGALISNTLAQGVLLDIIFGSLASLIAAIGTYYLRKRNKFFAPIPPILVNALIIPFVLRYGYGLPFPITFMMLTVGLGQVLSAGVLGMFLYSAVDKSKKHIFKM